MAKPVKTTPLRRSARVQALIPVTLSGKHPDGKSFAEDTYIVSVSKFGARLKTQHAFKVGAQVKVQPKQGRESAPFRVVWTGREGTPRAGEVGIEYIHVSNLFGVAFPD